MRRSSGGRLRRAIIVDVGCGDGDIESDIDDEDDVDDEGNVVRKKREEKRWRGLVRETCVTVRQIFRQ